MQLKRAYFQSFIICVLVCLFASKSNAVIKASESSVDLLLPTKTIDVNAIIAALPDDTSLSIKGTIYATGFKEINSNKEKLEMFIVPASKGATIKGILTLDKINNSLPLTLNLSICAEPENGKYFTLTGDIAVQELANLGSVHLRGNSSIFMINENEYNVTVSVSAQDGPMNNTRMTVQGSAMLLKRYEIYTINTTIIFTAKIEDITDIKSFDPMSMFVSCVLGALLLFTLGIIAVKLKWLIKLRIFFKLASNSKQRMPKDTKIRSKFLTIDRPLPRRNSI